MALNLDPVTGIVETVSKGVETVAGVFTANAENSAQRDSEEQRQLWRAYQSEFEKAQQRTWIDSIADAFNRLIRPFIVTIIISIFIIAYISPSRFSEISLAMSSVPNGYWALLSVIIGFYFGGRMQLKTQDFALKQSQVTAVKTLIETRKEFRKLEMDGDEPDKVVGDEIGKSNVLDVSRQSQKNGVVLAYLNAKNKDQDHEKLADTVKGIQSASNNDEPYIFQLDDMVD